VEVRNKWIEDKEEEWPADHPAVAAVAAAVGAYAAANPPSQPLEHDGSATRYPISTLRMTISILSSPISLYHIQFRYPG